MSPVLITQFVLLVFAVGLIGFTIRLYFWDWETRYPRRFIEIEVDDDAEIEDEVRKMRRAIEEWEHRDAA